MSETQMKRLLRLMEDGRYTEVRNVFRKTIQQDKRDVKSLLLAEPEAVLLIARAHRRLGYMRFSHKLLSHAVRENPTIAVMLDYARSCLQFSNVIKALKSLDIIKDKVPPEDDVLMARLHGTYARTYAMMGALESAASSIARASEYSTPRAESFLVIDQSLIYESSAQLELAEEILTRHLGNYPRAYSARIALATLMVKREQWENAVGEYTHTILYHPEAFFPHYNMGYQLLRIGRHVEALEAFKSADALAPDNDFKSSVSWGTGFSYFQEGDWEKALTCFRKTESKDMIKACLNLQLGRRFEERDFRIPLPLPTDGVIRSEQDVRNVLLAYFRIRREEDAEESRYVPSSRYGMRISLHEAGLITRAFEFNFQRLEAVLDLNVPIVTLFSDFEGSRHVLIYGYHPVREIFYVLDASERESSFEELTQFARSSDLWAMAVFTADLQEKVDAIIPRSEDEIFRSLEHAEEDIARGNVQLARGLLESLPPGVGHVTRLRLMHRLRRRLKPSASLEPGLRLLLKASEDSEGDIGFAAREYREAEDYPAALSLAKKALRHKAHGAAHFCADIALKMGRYSLATRYNALGLSRYPSERNLLVQRAICYRVIANYKETFRFLRLAQESSTEHPEILREIGETFRMRGEYITAESYLKKAVVGNPADRTTWQYLLELYEEQHRYRSLEIACQMILQQNRNEEWAYELAGAFLLRSGLYDNAMDLLDEGLRANPHSVPLNILHLQLLERMGRLEDAEMGYTAFLRKDPTNKKILTVLAILLINQERFDEAYPYLEQGLLVDPEFKPATIAMARLHALQNNIRTALDLVKRALTFSRPEQETLDLFYQLCTAHDAVQEGVNFMLSLGDDAETYTNAGYIYEVTDQFERALRLYHRALSLPGDPIFPLFRIAQIQFRKGEVESSRTFYQEILKHDPRHYGALEGIVLISLEKGDLTTAMNRMEEIVSLYPEHDSAMNMYLDIAEVWNQIPRARRFLESLAEQTENPERLFVIRGELEEVGNYFDLAMQYYKDALGQEEVYPPSILHIGILEFKRRNYDEALSCLDRFLEIQPDTPEAIFYRSRTYEKLGKNQNAISDCLQALELEGMDEEVEMEAYDLLTHLLENENLTFNAILQSFGENLPEHFYCRLGEAFERKGDFKTARLLYECDNPLSPESRKFDSIVGLLYIARQENDMGLMKKVRTYLNNMLDEMEIHPELYSPLECASLHEAVAFLTEGNRTLNELKDSIAHWRSAIRMTRTSWALERASYACLDLGELTGDESYFHEALLYLRELRNPIERTSYISPALGDAYYRLRMYQEAVREYANFFQEGEEDISLQPVFFRYLDALEKTHSPVSDINEIVEQKLQILESSKESASYRSALQERIFHNYMRSRQHRAALRTAIRSQGFLPGIFRYFRTIFRPRHKP